MKATLELLRALPLFLLHCYKISNGGQFEMGDRKPEMGGGAQLEPGYLWVQSKHFTLQISSRVSEARTILKECIVYCQLSFKVVFTCIF